MTRRPVRLGVERLDDRTVPAVLTVTTVSDTSQFGDGQLSLREALIAANQDGPGQPPNPDVVNNTVGAFGDDTIRFASGLTGTIFLAGGTLTVSDLLTIEGPGAASLTISGQPVPPPPPPGLPPPADRPFLIDSTAGTVTLRDVTIADGRPSGSGGGVLNLGAALTVERVTFINNGATNGGAIDSDGPLTVIDSLFTANDAIDHGGAIRASGGAGAVDIRSSSFVSNTAGTGGAVFTDRPLDILGSAFASNTAQTAGALFVGPTGAATVTDTNFDTNSTEGAGGAVQNFGSLTLNGGRFQGNNARISDGGAVGGAVANSGTLSVTGTRFDGNSTDPGGFGGAVFNNGQLTVTAARFDGNTAGSSGGAVYHGGAFPMSELTVADTLFTNNTSGNGGGVGVANPQGAERITNSTFTGNTATGLRGGGLFVSGAGGPLRLVNVTVTGNTADLGGGVAGNSGTSALGQFLLFNSVVAGNTSTGNGPADVFEFASEGGNVIGAADPLTLAGLRPSDIAGVTDAGLGSLDLYGGTVPVFRLLPGSPALGVGLATSDPPPGVTAIDAPPTDARGRPRPSGGEIDAGSFQAQRPTANPDVFTIGQNRPLTVPAAGVLSNDVNNDVFGPLTVALDTPPDPAQGAVTLNPDGSFTFTPVNGFVDTATFTYTATDGVTTSLPATVSIDVTAARRPTANPDVFTIGQNRPLMVAAPGVLANDVANDIFAPLTAALVTSPDPAQGTVTLNPDGSFTFTPAIRFVGTATFTYTATDGVTTSAPAAVTISVTPAPPPTANPDRFSVDQDGTLTFPAPGVLGNDTAVDFGPLSVAASTPPTAGTLALAPDGSFVYTPPPGFSGTVTFTYTATDGVTTSAPATVTIDVFPAAPPPTRLYAFGAGAGGAPRVRVFNADGTERFNFFAFEPTFTGGVRVAVGDVTGDGVDDIIAGAGPGAGPRVAVFDGTNAARVFDFFAYETTFSLGVHVAAADLDGDGRADIITGTGSGGGPRVQAFSGRNPADVLVNFFPYDSRFRGGVRVGAGDLTGDGRAEIVTAAGPSGGPDIGVYGVSGRAEVQLARFFAFDPGYRGGAFVSVGRASDGTSRLYVAPDSFPDFAGSELGDRFPVLSDTLGIPQGVDASDALLTRRPEVTVFALSADGRSVRADGTVPVLSAASTGGARVAGGEFRGAFGVFVASGPGGGGRVQFFPAGAGGGLDAPTLDLQAFDAFFLDSVYVGAGG